MNYNCPIEETEEMRKYYVEFLSFDEALKDVFCTEPSEIDIEPLNLEDFLKGWCQ